MPICFPDALEASDTHRLMVIRVKQKIKHILEEEPVIRTPLFTVPRKQGPPTARTSAFNAIFNPVTALPFLNFQGG